MTSNSVVGEWGNFVFKMIQPADHPRILQHLKDCLYYRAFYRIGYTKDLDVEMDAIFQLVLNDGYNLSFFAEDKATGKVRSFPSILIFTFKLITKSYSSGCRLSHHHDGKGRKARFPCSWPVV